MGNRVSFLKVMRWKLEICSKNVCRLVRYNWISIGEKFEDLKIKIKINLQTENLKHKSNIFTKKYQIITAIV
jgi:hypothetical protein